jgi:hypothetical protein
MVAIGGGGGCSMWSSVVVVKTKEKAKIYYVLNINFLSCCEKRKQ